MSAPGIDREQIALFLDTVFFWCDGLIPLCGLPEKGVDPAHSSAFRWLPREESAADQITLFAETAAQCGRAVYVIPGTVVADGQTRAEHLLQMQVIVVDLDDGDIDAKRDHLIRHLSTPTLIVESSGVTEGGQAKLHLWWKLTEPDGGKDLALLCRLRAEIVLKVGGDDSFASTTSRCGCPARSMAGTATESPCGSSAIRWSRSICATLPSVWQRCRRCLIVPPRAVGSTSIRGGQAFG